MIWRFVNLIFKLFNKIYFSNQKKSWELARNSSSTYQDIHIFKKVINCYEKYMNHSNNPSVDDDGIALKDIKIGDEITIDYRDFDDSIKEWLT